MEIMAWLLILFGANFLHLVKSVCLQNTSSSCFVSFTDLRKHVTSIQVSDLLVPAKNNTNHRLVCRLYEEYRSCKYTGFAECHNEIQKEMTIIDEVFDPICSKAFHDFVTESHCIHRFRRHYKVCHRKKHNKSSHVPTLRRMHTSHHIENRHCNHKSPHFKHQMNRSQDIISTAGNLTSFKTLTRLNNLFHSGHASPVAEHSITKDYIMCLYSVTALGCSIDVAENYFSILNQSLSTAFKYRGQLCILNHPLTAVSTTSASRLIMSHYVSTTPSIAVYSNLGSGNSAMTFCFSVYKIVYAFVFLCLIFTNLDQ